MKADGKDNHTLMTHAIEDYRATHGTNPALSEVWLIERQFRHSRHHKQPSHQIYAVQ
jgi:hypothetical protein